MTASLYEWIGRLVVRFVLVRYRRQIRIAAAAGIAALAAAGYAAITRQPPEG
jgi:hypothetical protein